ncbi:MAG: pyridoxal-phosphate dependent enzyme [Haloarculaceae archaeon]
MNPVAALECRRCGQRYDPGEVEYTCPAHDGVAGVLDVRYDYDAVEFEGPAAGSTDLWAYEPMLPVGEGERVSLGAGGTDTLDAPALGERLGVAARIKNETTNPTGSNKDRGSAVVVTRAVQRGHDVVTCASTGNAAASLAGYAARAGLACRIFVPGDLPAGKAVQPRLYGAEVLEVDGTYEEAYDLCRRASAERGWYNRNAAMNPYAVEGKRTLGFEISEEAPDADWVAMPMGNGCSLAAAWKGLADYRRLGRLSDPPRMLGVQAAGASPIYDRFSGDPGDEERRSDGTEPLADGDETLADEAGGNDRAAGTAADSIDVATPHNAGKACEALRESDGAAVVVDDDAILRAQRLLGETEGVFVEPASAAAVAGVERARREGLVAAGAEVVIVATGTGLKDPETASAVAGEVRSVPADVDAVPDDL